MVGAARLLLQRTVRKRAADAAASSVRDSIARDRVELTCVVMGTNLRCASIATYNHHITSHSPFLCRKSYYLPCDGCPLVVAFFLPALLERLSLLPLRRSERSGCSACCSAGLLPSLRP